MKNLLLIVFLMFGVKQLNAQVIITGFYTEPPFTDAPVTGGYEYIQLMATEAINFSTNNFCVMVAGNGGQAVTEDGWAGSPTNANHLKFNLTTGSVAKGEFFYVGNTKKLINGEYPAGQGGPSTDISAANWIRTINTGAQTGDDGIGNAATAGFLPYAANTACGIAVFSGTLVTSTTVPIDAVFYGGTLGNSNYTAPDKGYLVPVNNFFYNDGAGTQKYFGQGTNTTLVGPKSTSNDNQFYMMGGNYNTTTNVWISRSKSQVKLKSNSTLADIEVGAGVVTLPVELSSFTAQKTNKGIQLKWTTASEKDNNYFEILRSSDGIAFENLSKVLGAGNSSAAKSYSFNDENPLPGTNYYQLNQVDYNGKSSKSKVIAIRSDLQQTGFKIISTQNNNLVFSVYANENINGKILVSGLSGRTILNTIVALKKGFNQYNVSMPSLSKGLYIANLRVGQLDAGTVKFIK